MKVMIVLASIPSRIFSIPTGENPAAHCMNKQALCRTSATVRAMNASRSCRARPARWDRSSVNLATTDRGDFYGVGTTARRRRLRTRAA